MLICHNTHMNLFTAVEIEINSNCNMSCSYCPNAVAERIEQGYMTIELYEKIINQLLEIKFEGRISYDFYNEPTLSPNLVNFIELTKKKLPKCSIELYSNGTKLDMTFFDTLENAGVDKFIITKHEKINHIIFDDTYENLSSSQLKKIIYRKYNEINLTNRGGTLHHIHGKINTTLLPCQIPTSILTITNKGNVIACFEDFYQKNTMGNIQDLSLIEIWNSKKYISFRKKLLQGLRHQFEACKDCSRTEVVME